MTATQSLEMLLTFSLQVCVVVAATTYAERTIAKAADRSSLWNVCFLGILFLVATNLLMPRLHVFQPWRTFEPQVLISIAAVQVSIAKFLFKVWALGAIVFLARWIAHGLWLRAAIRRCEPVPQDRVRELLGISAGSHVEELMPRLLISDDAEGPYCVQLHRPIIVLPRILMEGSGDDLHHVLIHEYTHLRCHHPIQLFFQQFVQVLCWFHPAVWRASSRASLVREFDCDDAVISSGVHSAAYLRTLLHIAERSAESWPSSAISFGQTPTELILRVKRLVELAQGQRSATSANRWLRKPLAILIVMIATCCVTLVSVPTDPMSSSRAAWSAWPSWTAGCLHCFGIPLRDYEQFDRRVRAYEQLYDNGDSDTRRFDHAQDALRNTHDFFCGELLRI